MFESVNTSCAIKQQERTGRTGKNACSMQCTMDPPSYARASTDTVLFSGT